MPWTAPARAAMPRAKKLSPEAICLLDTLPFDEGGPPFAALLNGGVMLSDRKLYVEANAAMESLGGKWHRLKKRHLFDVDPRAQIDAITAAGEFVAAADMKKLFQPFFTPAPLAAHLVELAEVRPGMNVLEPSAGRGAIVDAILAAGGSVFAVEIQSEMAAALNARPWVPGGVACLHADFLRVEKWDHQRTGAMQLFDRVVMNPPFSGQQDVDHVRHAFEFLKPGGRLVAVMSDGTRWRENKKAADFRRWCGMEDDGAPLSGREIYEWGPSGRDRISGNVGCLESGAFSSSETNVQSCVVVLDKVS